MTQIRLAPTPRPLPGRETVLNAVLNPDRLPVMPAVALRVVQAASQPDCRVTEIVSLLSQDPVLCAKLLKAVNSASVGRSRPVSSIERAVVVVGLNKLRSLALGLSLPAMRPKSRMDATVREHALSSVGGAIIARELAVRLNHPSPEDDLVAGLLRDLGMILARQTYPDLWTTLTLRRSDPLDEQQCEREREAFGVDHAEIGAEVLRNWNLPGDVVEPIRHHHQPARLAGADPHHAIRAELLWFAGLLTKVHTLVEFPEELDRILTIANEQYHLSRSELADFLQQVWPKIDEYSSFLSQDVGKRPDYAALLSSGKRELRRLRDFSE